MPLTRGELDRCRAELGYHLLNTGAQPFIGVHMVFEQVILPYLREGTDTTSSTTVDADSVPGYCTIVVADPTLFVLHERIAVDVDDFLEMATVRSVSSTSIGVFLKKAHAGTYPVTTDGGLLKVRECLAAISECHQEIRDNIGLGGTKKVDEIEFYDSKQKSKLNLCEENLDFWRDQLRACFGIERRPHNVQSGGFASLS
jgi:hypothetical protein